MKDDHSCKIVSILVLFIIGAIIVQQIIIAITNLFILLWKIIQSIFIGGIGLLATGIAYLGILSLVIFLSYKFYETMKERGWNLRTTGILMASTIILGVLLGILLLFLAGISTSDEILLLQLMVEITSGFGLLWGISLYLPLSKNHKIIQYRKKQTHLLK